MKFLTFISFILFLAQFQVESANILYLSNIGSPSHFIWFKALLTTLHERGHNITAVSPDVEKSRPNFTYIHLEKIYPSLYNGSVDTDYLKMGKKNSMAMSFEIYKFGKAICKAALESDGYQKILNYPESHKFDLVIYDFTMGSCLLGLVHKFNYPPMVSVSPFVFSQRGLNIIGSPIFPAFSPPFDMPYPQDMNFVQRVISTTCAVFEVAVDYFYWRRTDYESLKMVHPDVPWPSEIEKKATRLFMVNSNPIIDYRLPTFPNLKLVGGAQIRKPKELPKEINGFFENAKGPVVLFSLGTNVRSDKLGDEKILRILKAFKRLPHVTFLWKFETKEKLPIELPPNVKIQSFMPQNDILAHPKTKLFISHTGLLSSQEALWWGVPVIGFPIFADQIHNSYRLTQLGVAETLSIHDFTEDQLYETVKKILENPSYQNKIKSLSAAWRDQPMTPNEEAAYWVEWVLRHPDVDISAPSINQPIFVRHSLDVLGFFVLVLLILLVTIKKLFKIITKFFTPNTNILHSKKKKE